MIAFYWHTITTRQYDFARPRDVAKQLRHVTKQQLLHLFQHGMHDAATRSKLSMQLFSGQPPSPSTVPAGAGPSTVVQDVAQRRLALPLYEMQQDGHVRK